LSGLLTEKYLYQSLAIASIMADTAQLNLRLSKDLLADLNLISEHLHVGKTEWLKVKIAEVISKERAIVLFEIDERYVKGSLDDREYQNITGMVPSSAMKEKRRKKK